MRVTIGLIVGLIVLLAWGHRVDAAPAACARGVRLAAGPRAKVKGEQLDALLAMVAKWGRIDSDRVAHATDCTRESAAERLRDAACGGWLIGRYEGGSKRASHYELTDRAWARLADVQAVADEQRRATAQGGERAGVTRSGPRPYQAAAVLPTRTGPYIRTGALDAERWPSVQSGRVVPHRSVLAD